MVGGIAVCTPSPEQSRGRRCLRLLAETVQLLVDDTTSASVPAQEVPGRPEICPAGMLWVSPSEAAILEALRDGTVLSSEQIAHATGLAHTDRLKSILTNLVERNGIFSQGGKGYKLAEASLAVKARPS
jgi:hypothetical protein